MYKHLDIYNDLYKSYKNYILENCSYDIKICKKTPKSLAKFPTIVMNESINITDNHTTNRQEFIDILAYTVEIYSKDTVVDGKIVASDDIMRDLEYTTFEFFRIMGFDRDTCEATEYIDITVDRKVMIFSCRLSSWNRKII